jgi:hypothetical protein
VDGLLSNHYLSKWFVAAELAYTHDQAQMRKHIGSPAPITSLDWDRITPYYACSMWTDFFAQRVAYRYRPTGWLERRDLWIRSAVESRLIHYLAMFYPPRYWPRYEGFQDVIDVLAIYRDAFTNIGWHLGVLAAAAEDGYDGLHTDYYAALEETAPGWGLPARQFAEELDIVAHTAWASSRFDQLARIIERTLRTHHVIA